MSRLWSRVGVRVSSVALLLVGVGAGVYLGNDKDVQQQGTDTQLAVRSQANDQQLLAARRLEHAAARERQRVAEVAAATKAAKEAKAAASKARKVEAAAIRKAKEKKAERDRNVPPPPFAGPIPESCNEFSGNRKIGCALLLQRGFKLDQMPCLNKLWNKESGWNHRASNRNTGAYGIPQALPGSKMKSAGRNWKTDPAVQIKWGLGYIKGRYKTPCKAWGFFQSNGWY